jgi:hypothetical protein
MCRAGGAFSGAEPPWSIGPARAEPETYQRSNHGDFMVFFMVLKWYIGVLLIFMVI